MGLMKHEDCRNWDYESHPQVSTVEAACASFLTELRAAPSSKTAALADTRPLHAIMFGAVVPTSCSYIAGNYRGQDFECLRDCRVGFWIHEGTPPVGVPLAMEYFHNDLIAGLAELDNAVLNTNRPLQGPAFLVRLVQLLAASLTRFFTIHPYANGNGHMGRLIVWAALGKYNRLPIRWWLHGKPPGYGDYLTAHRNGDPKPLEKFLLRCIIG